MAERKREKISYESIIAGLLLKFKLIDNVDFSLIVEDFKNLTKTDVCGSWYIFGKYVKRDENGIISLADGITLDYFIEEENQTLAEKLLEVAGNKVSDYIKGIDIEKYKAEKGKILTDNKEKVLNEANVLLISDIQDDYDELIKYGFKNVDYFKSIIRADAYFAKKPEELEKYHLIIKGNQNVQYCCLGGNVELDTIIDRLGSKKNNIVLTLFRYDYSDYIELNTYLSDMINYRNWKVKELTYQGIFDRIVENMLINHTLEKVTSKDKEFVPIEDKINPNKLPLPVNKSDLRILYLDSIRISDFAQRIAEELKLDITFKEDNNYGLGRHVKTHLGDYDIIIVSNMYSSNLLCMNNESTEQCKDTGRQLTLLVSYNNFYYGVDGDLGDGIRLNYRYGGNAAPNLDFYSKEFRVLRQKIEIEEGDEYWKKYSQSEYSQMKSIIEASVNFYNEALTQIGKNSISDLDFKTASEFDNEYISVIENIRKRKEAELAPIKSFDNIRNSILSYLFYRNNGLINQTPDGLRIIEGDDGIKVENIYQGRTLCTIAFPKNYEHDYLRIFKIQTLSKKGTLSSPQIIGLYTSKYDGLEGIPNRPNEKQERALISIEKKINSAISPLNKEAWMRYLGQKEYEQTRIKRKDKKRRR